MIGVASVSMLAQVATSSVAIADDFTPAVTITGSTDYMFRGISFTDNSATVNAYVEVGYKSFYLAGWTSTLDYDMYGPWEQDIYLGFRHSTGPIDWDVSANYYIYGNRDHGEFGSISDLAYYEFKIGASTAVTKELTLGALAWLAPDQGYATTKNLALEGTAAYKLPDIGKFAPSLTGLVGWQHSGTNQYYTTGYWLGRQDYTYWNAGLKVNVDKFFMDFRYWGTTIDDDLSGDRFVFSAGVNLP